MQTIKDKITVVRSLLSDEEFDLEDSIVFDGYEYWIYFSDLTDAYYCNADNFRYHIEEGSEHVCRLASLLQDIFIVLAQNGVDQNLLQLK